MLHDLPESDHTPTIICPACEKPCPELVAGGVCQKCRDRFTKDHNPKNEKKREQRRESHVDYFSTPLDEQGHHVLTSDFAYPKDGEEPDMQSGSRTEREITFQIFHQLSSGNASALEIGRRVLVHHYFLSREGSQRQLAERLGVKEAAVSMRLAALRKQLRDGNR